MPSLHPPIPSSSPFYLRVLSSVLLLVHLCPISLVEDGYVLRLLMIVSSLRAFSFLESCRCMFTFFHWCCDANSIHCYPTLCYRPCICWTGCWNHLNSRSYVSIGMVRGFPRVLEFHLTNISAPKWIRGAVVALYQWAITIGLLLAAVVNNATKDRPNHSAYRIPIAIQLVWAFVLSTGMIILPEARAFLHVQMICSNFHLVSSLAHEKRQRDRRCKSSQSSHEPPRIGS